MRNLNGRNKISHLVRDDKTEVFTVFKYFFRSVSGNFSIAYRRHVRGIVAAYLSRNFRSTGRFRLPISRSIHPTAFWIRSCESKTKISAIESASVKSPFLMKPKVVNTAIRRCHTLSDFAKWSSRGVGCVRNQSPRTYGADESTKSQLFTWSMFAR